MSYLNMQKSAVPFRSLDPDSRVKAREYLEQIVKGISEAHGAKCEVTWYFRVSSSGE
ncbi:hypothetical protein RCO48_35600 [Peribacillus frigoritolerans]|nr:hypothetical protein [Peribacillus frigoritolerans]